MAAVKILGTILGLGLVGLLGLVGGLYVFLWLLPVLCWALPFMCTCNPC
jgi:hypothetical protein